MKSRSSSDKPLLPLIPSFPILPLHIHPSFAVWLIVPFRPRMNRDLIRQNLDQASIQPLSFLRNSFIVLSLSHAPKDLALFLLLSFPCCFSWFIWAYSPVFRLSSFHFLAFFFLTSSIDIIHFIYLSFLSALSLSSFYRSPPPSSRA